MRPGHDRRPWPGGVPHLDKEEPARPAHPRGLEDNLGAEGWRLDDDHVARLHRASQRPPPYPFDMYQRLGLPFG